MVPLVSHSGFSRVLITTFNRSKGRGVFLRGILVARWSQDSASVSNALAYCAFHLACHALVAGSRGNLFGPEVAFSAAIRSRIDGDILVFKSATGSSNLCAPTFSPMGCLGMSCTHTADDDACGASAQVVIPVLNQPATRIAYCRHEDWRSPGAVRRAGGRVGLLYRTLLQAR